MQIAVKENQYSQSLRVTNIDTILKMMESGHFDERINAIRNEPDKKARTRLKNDLPQMFMFEPKDADAGSTILNVNAHNGLFVFDIDVYDRFDEIKKQVFDKLGPVIVFAFKSPSGGLKFALRSKEPISDDDEYKRVYKALTGRFKDKLGIECELDSQTCNINRATYVSDSSFVYKNLDVEPLDMSKTLAKVRADIAEDMKMIEIEQRHYTSAPRNEERATRFRNSTRDKILSRIGPGNRHTSIFQLGMLIYKTGGCVTDCTHELEMLRMRGNYTESMTPANKARDIHRYWVRRGSQLEACCFSMTRETTVALIDDILAS